MQVRHYWGLEYLSIVQDDALFDFTLWGSRFAGLTEYEMDRNYELIVDEAKAQSSLPPFDVAR